MQDPYTSEPVAATRLLSEYGKHGSLIVALDFDDTVFDFHQAGHTYTGVIDVVRRSQVLGFKIVLFTGTHPDKWEWQKRYLADLGINVEPEVNKNCIELPFGNHGKMYYNILLDDRAGLGQALQTLTDVVTAIEEGL